MSAPAILPDTHPLLRQKSQPVSVFDDRLAEITERMHKAMQVHDGAGLAAVQIGVNLRVIVAQLSDGWVVMVNPELVRSLRRCVTAAEGCLSVPREKWGDVTRPAKCEVSWTDLDGQTHQRSFSGFDARLIQHELDHLDGILMTDRMVI